MKTFLFLMMLVPLLAQAGPNAYIIQAQHKEVALSEHERRILEIGEISDAQYIGGGLLSIYPGFGVGHIVQGRWTDTGWIFTAGEIGTLAMIVSGMSGCMDEIFSDDECSDGEQALITVGFLGLIGFRIWEAVDAWVAPRSHNSAYWEITGRINRAPMKQTSSSLDLVPLRNTRLGSGLALKYTF